MIHPARIITEPVPDIHIRDQLGEVDRLMRVKTLCGRFVGVVYLEWYTRLARHPVTCADCILLRFQEEAERAE